MGAAAPAMPYIMAALSAAGTGATMVSQQDTLHKQDQIAAQGIMRQGQLNSQADQKVSDLTQKLAASNPQDAIDKQKASYMKALMSVAPAQAGANPTMPGASKKYANDVSNADANVQNYGTTQAGIMARTDAPTIQRLGEQEQIGSTAGDLGLIQNQSVGQQDVTKLGIQSTHSNPWVAAAAAAAQGVSAGYSKVHGWNSAAPTVDNGSNNTPASAYNYTVGNNGTDAWGP